MQSGHTLIYTYLMVHGMARGYVMSGGLDRDQLGRLILADRTALLAVATETAQPSRHNLLLAGEAVQALLAEVTPGDEPATRTASASRL